MAPSVPARRAAMRSSLDGAGSWPVKRRGWKPSAARWHYSRRANLPSEAGGTGQGKSPVYTKHRLATLRFYFRFLRQNGILEYNWSFAVPKVIESKNRNVPAPWEKDDLERLLKGIGRGNVLTRLFCWWRSLACGSRMSLNCGWTVHTDQPKQQIRQDQVRTHVR